MFLKKPGIYMIVAPLRGVWEINKQQLSREIDFTNSHQCALWQGLPVGKNLVALVF
jgi:hypothetical protein